MANKKILSVLSTAAIGSVLAAAVGTTAIAKVDGLVVKNAEGTYMNYDLEALKESVIEDALGNEEGAVLYNGFDADRANGELVSYHDDATGFVDADAVQNAAIDAALNGGEFDLNTFTESAEETALPETVYQAELEDGQVVAGEEVAPEEATDELKVESVSAINAKTLGVKFAKEPTAEEKANLTFAVKNGDATVLTKVDSWDGATAKIVRTSGTAYDAGDYTVTVTGLPEGANNVGVTTIEAQEASELEVSTTTLTDATAKAKVALVYQDQYGTDLTLAAADFTATAYNKTQGKSVTVLFDTTDKYFYVNTLTNVDDFKKDDVISVTFIHNETGVKTTKELTVGLNAYLDTISLGDIQLPTGKTILTSDLNDVKVAYTAADQYGNDVELSATNTTIVSSDEAILAASDVSFIADTDSQNKVKIAKFKKEGKVTLTLLSKASGSTATITLDIQQAAGEVANIAVAESTKTIAANSTGYVALTVTDKYGDAVAEKDYVGELNVTSSNPSVSTDVSVVSDTADEEYGKLKVVVLSSAPKDTTSTITITDSTTGKQYATVVVKAGEAAKPSSIGISSDSEHVTSLIVGASTTVEYTVKDQFGNDWTVASGDYSVVYAIKDSADAISVDSLTDDTDETAAEAVITAAKSGTATLEAKLMKGAELVDTKEVTFTVTANNASGLTYSIKPISKLAADKTYAVNGTSAYAQPVVVEAIDANGAKYAVDPSQILSAELVGANGYFQIGTKVAVDPANVDAQEGYFAVAANIAADSDAPTDAKVRVAVNTADGVEFIESEPLTFDSAAPVAQEMRIANKAADINDPSKLPTNTADVTALTFDNIAGAIAGAETASTTDAAKVFVNIKDQYGVWSTVAADFVLNSTTVLSFGDAADKFATTDLGAFTLTDADSDTQFTANETIKLSAFKGSATDTITITIKAETAPTVATALGDGLGDEESILAAGTDTVVFSELLSSDSKTAVENALKAAVAGVAGSDLGFAWNDTTFTLTVTNNHASTAATFAADVTVDITDVYGNTTSDAVIVTQ